jgi:hypothetical protein
MATVKTSREGDITKLTATIDKTKLEEELESEEDQP